mgnify:CR=1 FL=1
MSYFCLVKLLKRIVSWTIWGIISLNLVLMGISHIPAAQHYIGSKVAEVVGHTLGTQVTVGRVDLGFLNRIIIDDVHILDQQKKEMVHVARMTAKVDIGPMMDGKIAISSAQLFGARFQLYRKHADGKNNFQFVLDSLASNDTTSHTPLDLRVNSFIMRHTSVDYDLYDVAPTEGIFNPAHLHLKDLTANISLKTLTEDSINVNVKRFSFREDAGLEVSNIAFRLAAGRKDALLSGLLVQMPSSQLEIDTLKANYLITEKGLEPGSATLKGKIDNTLITPSDLRCFLPSLKNFQRPVNILVDLNGTDKHINIPELRIATEEQDIAINANGWIEQFMDHPFWHLQLNQAVLSETSIDFLTKTIKQIPSELTRIGNLQVSGTCDRSQQGLTSIISAIRSGAGDMDVKLTMATDRTFHGDISTDGVRLQQLLADDRFGTLSTKINLNGQLHDKQKPDITVNGKVSQFDYNGYSYENIALDGQYANGLISGVFSIDDAHASAQLRGELADNIFDGAPGKASKIKLQGSINHFAPGVTHLAETWGDAVISAEIDADFMARTLNDAEGSVRIRRLDISATEEHEAYKLDNLFLSSGYNEGVHFLTLKSDFADAELKGRFDYGTLKQSFTNLIASKLPTLPGLPPTKATNNNFSLRLLMSKTDWLKRFLGIDLQLQQPFSLQARVNDHTREVTLDGDLPAFTYNGAPYSDGQIRITTPADTLKASITINKLMDNGHQLNISLQANAASNNITTSLLWDNHQEDERLSGQLNTMIQLYRNALNKSEAHMRIRPSHVILNNSTWNVEPSDILYYENFLLVDHFSVQHGKQHILVDGIASKSSEDRLTVDLNEVEVSYILDLVNFHSVEFSGKASGRASASALFSKFAAHADLRVDDFKFERGAMGTLHAHADWNQEKEQIDIDAVAVDDPGKTTITGYVSPVHNTIDLQIDADKTSIEFMHNFTKTFLTSISGQADGSARLLGTLDNINLVGNLVVDGEATVTALNTTYQLQRDTVVMIPDEIELHDMAVYDRYGHEAILSGGIHHKHLTSLTFDLFVDADNLLGYDFADFGENTFYGTVFASGNVAIHGLPNEVIIDCDITPEKNSFFVYNAASPDAISKQEFIEWDTSDNTSGTGTSLLGTHNYRATDTDIYINFLINCTPDATMRLLMDANTKDYINLNGEGAIRATFHNKGPFNMFGTYTVDHGTYGITIQNVIKKNFTFNRGGTIVFGGDPYNAALNLQAVYTVNGVSLSDLNIGNSFTNNTIRVNCLMNIGGQPNAPRVDFDLEMPTVNADEQQMVRSVINGQQEMNQQVIYLLGIGRFYNQGANNNTGDDRPDQTSLAMQSFLSGTLSTQINTLLNQFIKNENWNFGANISTGNEGWHNAEYEGIINGRMLNNRLLFNGQFGYRDNATQANPSFIGDFDVQYLLYPNGNLALKVYNQTNDRYFTKSSLNTQGIGVIMKKDFNSLRDLFSSQKKKKKKKETENR